MVSFFLFIFFIFKSIKSSIIKGKNNILYKELNKPILTEKDRFNKKNVFNQCCQLGNLNKDTFCVRCQQEDFDYLRNLEFDRSLIEDIGYKFHNNLSNHSEAFVLYYCHKRSTFNSLFIFISTVLNNLISIFNLNEVEKVVYGHETPEEILLLNCNQILHCFWAINSLPKSRFKLESEIEDVIFEADRIENFINILSKNSLKGRVLFCNSFYWKNIPFFEEYDIKLKIKYLLKKFNELGKFQKIFRESILILLFCYDLPDAFLLNNKYQLIQNFISKMTFFFEIVKHEDKIKNEENFLNNLNISIEKSNEIICQYKLTMKLKLILNEGKLDVLNRIELKIFDGPNDVINYWNLIGLLRGKHVTLNTHNFKWTYDHTSCVAKFQDFMVHFMKRINELMIKVL